MSPLRPALLAALLVGSAACAAGGGAETDAAPAPPAPASTTDRERLERLEALYEARRDSATMDFHPADVHFITGMIVHHAQALVMAGWAPERAATDALRTLAARITNAQRDEITLMQRWLRDRGQPVPQVDERGHVSGPGADMRMQGLLTDAQLRELERARGAAFDSLFLTYMIPHHQGAVAMVHHLFSTDGAAQGDLVFKLASDIQVDQSSEIARMQRMLDAMAGPTPR